MQVRRVKSRVLAWGTCILLAALRAPPAGGWDGVIDPIYVWFPRDSCRGEFMDLEVWNRRQGVWEVHPTHGRIRVDTCQLEDAGVLLHEIRRRCFEEPGPWLPPAWIVGVEVFAPEIIQRCKARAARGEGFGELGIHVSSPKPGETVRNERMSAEVRGSVGIGGLEGANYDIAIAIDTSEAVHPEARGGRGDGVDLIGAQVAAVRAFVRSLTGRLGEVRIGLLTFSGLPSDTGVRREVALTADPRALHRGLDAIVQRRAAGASRFSSALAFAVDELARQPARGGTRRPGAHGVVILLAEGRGKLPFGGGASRDPAFRERNIEQARIAGERGIALELFALGESSTRPPEFIRQMLEHAAGRFTRIDHPEEISFLLERVQLPEVERLTLRNESTEEETRDLSVSNAGHFREVVSMKAGENLLRLFAQTSDGQTSELELVLNFDISLVRAKLRRAERERIRQLRMQQKRLTIEAEDEILR
jgi:hypothetical protein